MLCLRLQPPLRALREGGVIAYPTEGVYGLGCDPRCRSAIERLLALKHRSWHKGLILVAANLAQLDGYLARVDPVLRSRAAATWPGPVTWLWPARPEVPRWVRGRSRSVAVRVSAHPLVRELCLRHGGALISTSANHSGAAPARSAAQVRARFPAGLGAILAGSLGGLSKPTEIRDLVSGAVLRPAAG